jgi:WD40 repeat protein/energy-coupling factor transporter ATP-binding protein EcfA2
MLNYDLQSGQVEDTLYGDFHQEAIGFNPFPGLRPFGIDESHLFFGREGQVDEILVKLSKHKFVTLLGQSGSGKSSLINCGVIPILLGGFMTTTGPYWQIIHTRPGQSPFGNLTDSIISFLVQENRIDKNEVNTHRLIISSILKSGSNGLIELCKYLRAQQAENIFFQFDQFEELFRFKSLSKENADEAAAFVNLILTAIRNKSLPIYIVLAMRSDFVGDASIFPGLTHLINLSNYLIPQMTREQKRMAVEGPIAVGGGRISQRLVKKLLSDIGDNQDQLPILQHALMRTWDYWVENRDKGESIDIRHYNAVGRIYQAISLHANEAYEELSARQKEIAEVLFKATTEKNQQNQWLRRPCRLGVIAQIAECGEQELVDVIEKFRQPGRSFLMPAVPAALNTGSSIEISHESLMRIWTKLGAWVEEEYESAQMYKRISEAAALYQNGKTSLWRPPDLQLALNWQTKQRPSRSWAQRYDEAFERAIVFLDTSRITYEAELKNQEMAQQRMLRRARITSVVLGIAALIVSVFFLYALNQTIQTESARQLAEEQKILAENSALEAVKARLDAETNLNFAKEQEAKALEANEQLIIEKENLDKALQNLQVALADAQEQRKIAEQQSLIATTQSIKADSALRVALNARNEQERQFMLSIAKTIAVQSLRIEDNDLKGNLAMMSFRINKEYGGKDIDPEVYNALYNSQASIQGASYNTIAKAHNNAVRTVVLANTSDNFFSSGSDGKVLKGNFVSKNIEKLIGRNISPVRVIALSKSDRYLAVGTDSANIQLYDLAEPAAKPKQISGHKGRLNALHFTMDGLYSASSDKTIRFTDPNTGQMRTVVSTPYEIKSFAINNSGKDLIGATVEGVLLHVDLQTRIVNVLKVEGSIFPIHSVSFHRDNKTIVFGNERGSIKIYDIETKTLLLELFGHKSGVTTVAFSPDGKYLASAAKDGRMQMWTTSAYNELPVVIEDIYQSRNTAYIWDMKFTKDGKFIVSGAEDGSVRVWPTNPVTMAETICNKIKRNMTPEEWDNYVGNDIPYRTTCVSLIIDGI